MTAILPFLWPTVALIALLVIAIAGRKLAGDVRPIFVNVVDGVAKNAGSNAQAYVIAFMFGIVASGSAFADLFAQLDRKTFAEISWHQYLAMWVKALVPFVSSSLAYATQNKFVAKGGSTTPPFPVNPPAT